MRKQLIALALLLPLIGAGCIGSYRAFNGVESWNTRATDSRWWNTAIHIGFWILPVYELCFIGDALIFNTIEFWTGSNPFNQPPEPQEGGQPKK